MTKKGYDRASINGLCFMLAVMVATLRMNSIILDLDIVDYPLLLYVLYHGWDYSQSIFLGIICGIYGPQVAYEMLRVREEENEIKMMELERMMIDDDDQGKFFRDLIAIIRL